GDGLVSTSFRARSLEELSTPLFRQRTRRKVSKETKLEPASPGLTPILKGRGSVTDLIFEMSDEEGEPSGKRSGTQTPGENASQYRRLDDSTVGSPDESWSE